MVHIYYRYIIILTALSFTFQCYINVWCSSVLLCQMSSNRIDIDTFVVPSYYIFLHLTALVCSSQHFHCSPMCYHKSTLTSLHLTFAALKLFHTHLLLSKFHIVIISQLYVISQFILQLNSLLFNLFSVILNLWLVTLAFWWFLRLCTLYLVNPFALFIYRIQNYLFNHIKDI